jgi:hypothetical protein
MRSGMTRLAMVALVSMMLGASDGAAALVGVGSIRAPEASRPGLSAQFRQKLVDPNGGLG